MKRYIFLSLLLSVVILGCDPTPEPQVDIVFQEGEFDGDAQVLPFDLSITANFEILEIEVIATALTPPAGNPGGELYRYFSTPTSTNSVVLSEGIFLDNYAGDIEILITVRNENVGTYGIIEVIESVQEESATLQLTTKLLYDGEPMVLFTDYDYPDGSTITFTRYSTYFSGLSLDGGDPSDQVVYAPISDNNVETAFAAAGYAVSFKVDPGTYQGFSLALGLDPEANAMMPSDFPSGHPLSNSGEYWLSWRSYVFTKVEGTIDIDGDGTVDRSFALHLGGDDAYSRIEADMILEIEPRDIEMVDLELDLYDWLTSVDGGPYDLFADGSIHSLSHQPLIDQLLGNYDSVFQFK